jgi:LacI family transcriptional regulator
VGIDLELTGPRCDVVVSDNEMGARLAVEHLIALGHRRIATITGLLETRPGTDRLRGYRTALQAAGLAFRDEYVAYGDFYVESGRLATEAFLALDEPPTAIFAASDLEALGAVRAAVDAGLTVPGSFSVVGFDDIDLAAHVQPAITTVRQDKAGLGRAAGRALVARVEDRSDGPQQIVLPVTLVERGSSASPPSS